MHKYRAIDYFDVNSSKVGFHLEQAYIHRNSDPHMVHMVCVQPQSQLIITIQSQDRSDISGYFKRGTIAKIYF